VPTGLAAYFKDLDAKIFGIAELIGQPAVPRW